MLGKAGDASSQYMRPLRFGLHYLFVRQNWIISRTAYNGAQASGKANHMNRLI